MAVFIRSLGVRDAASVLCLSALVLIAGCGKSSAKVSGKVTLDGQPLKGGGTVTFEGSKGSASGPINPDNGIYTIPNAPVGDVKIAVTSGWTAPPPEAKMKPVDLEQIKAAPSKLKPSPRVAPPRPLANVPKKYAKSETSGLTSTVKSGDQIVDIPLTR